MIDWLTIGLVLGAAAMLAAVNYWGMSRATQRQAATAQRPTAHEALEAMERALSSQAARLDAQSRRIDELEAAMDAQEAAHRAELVGFREELEEAHRGLKLLLAQITEAKMTPVWTPPKRPAKKPGGAGGPLAVRIAEGFNREEVDNLAFDVGLVADNLSGGVDSRARQLVDMARRVGRLGELERRVNELRPKDNQ